MIDQREVKQLVHQLSVCQGRVIQLNLLISAVQAGEISAPENTLQFMLRQTQEVSDESNQLMGYLKLLFQGAE